MELFGQPKDSLYGFLPVFVKIFKIVPVAILVRFLYRILPDMPSHYLYMRLTEGALIQMRTMLANSRVALVFPVSIPVRRTVTENFICRAKIAVKEFVIDMLP